MTNKRVPLVTGQLYHIYNRGISRQPVFSSKWDYEQSVLTMWYYQYCDPPVRLSRFKELSVTQREDLLLKLKTLRDTHIKIISYVFMPNHFHFLLKQISDNGISIFLSKFSNSYTKYFNTKHKRFGPIFQGVFKSVHIETDEQLIHLSRYIHLNPLVSYIVKEKDFLSYPWSSLQDFLKGKPPFVDVSLIFNHFSSPSAYQKYVLDQADYAKRLESIKHLILEN